MRVFGVRSKRYAKRRKNKAKFAKYLRRHQTLAERRLWPFLKLEKFKRQVVIAGYIADFAHPKARLIVEADGEYHKAPGIAEQDKLRDWHLFHRGYKVLRFTNQEVLGDPKAVHERIMMAMPSKYSRLPKSSVKSSPVTHVFQTASDTPQPTA
jgi:very-short-patch-repair endonuclease